MGRFRDRKSTGKMQKLATCMHARHVHRSPALQAFVWSSPVFLCELSFCFFTRRHFSFQLRLQLLDLFLRGLELLHGNFRVQCQLFLQRLG